MEEVLKAVAGVNWRKLGEVLNGMLHAFSLLINLDRIFEEYESDEARLRAVVEKSWEDLSWRKVIWALYCANEIDKAQQIRSYAEPLQGILIHVYYDQQALQAIFTCTCIEEKVVKFVHSIDPI